MSQIITLSNTSAQLSATSSQLPSKLYTDYVETNVDAVMSGGGDQEMYAEVGETQRARASLINSHINEAPAAQDYLKPVDSV